MCTVGVTWTPRARWNLTAHLTVCVVAVPLLPEPAEMDRAALSAARSTAGRRALVS